MRPNKNGRINSWKWLFLALLACMLGTGLVLFSRVQTKREDLTQLVVPSEEDAKVGSFSTNREQLNDTITQYLKDYQTDSFRYQLYLTSQQIVFEGTYQVLGVDIPLYVYLQPSRLEDGSIALGIEEISAGSLSLPKTEMLTYIQKNYKLPSLVKIDAQAARIEIQLTQLENQLGLYAKANTIDLYNDQIIVDIYRKKQK